MLSGTGDPEANAASLIGVGGSVTITSATTGAISTDELATAWKGILNVVATSSDVSAYFVVLL